MARKKKPKSSGRKRSPLSFIVVLTAMAFAYLAGSGRLGELRQEATDLGRRAGEALNSITPVAPPAGDASAPAATPTPESASATTPPAKPTAPGTIDIAAANPGEAPPAISVYFAPDPENSKNGPDDALINLIGSARESVFCAFYDLELESVADALIARKNARVKVEVVSDTNYEGRTAIKRVIEAKIPVVFDERSSFMHNKFCVIDGGVVWTGSTNVTNNCMYRNDNNSVVVRSKYIAENYTAEFGEMFNDHYFGPRSPSRTPHPIVKLGDVEVQNYFAPEDGVEEKIIEQIGYARKSIIFMAYSFTSDPIADAMVAAIKRGVPVRGIFESRTMKDKACEDDKLRRAGAEVISDKNPYNMHSKVIVVDAATVITGSYNFSRNANEDNDENLLIISSREIAEKYVARFEELAK